MRRSAARVLVAVVAGAALACGSSYNSPSASGPGTGFFIVISSSTFIPLNLHVPAGATVTVINQDGMAHSVTSEATAGAFTKGSVGGVSFDTGPFTGARSFTVPANAANGTVIPYFCSVHTSTMATPNGAITIDPSAVPTPAPGGGGGY